MALLMLDCPITRCYKMQQANLQNKQTIMPNSCFDVDIAHSGILETFFALALPNNVMKNDQGGFAAFTQMQLRHKSCKSTDFACFTPQKAQQLDKSLQHQQ